jgi:hypothetical protein
VMSLLEVVIRPKCAGRRPTGTPTSLGVARAPLDREAAVEGQIGPRPSPRPLQARPSEPALRRSISSTSPSKSRACRTRVPPRTPIGGIRLPHRSTDTAPRVRGGPRSELGVAESLDDRGEGVELSADLVGDWNVWLRAAKWCPDVAGSGDKQASTKLCCVEIDEVAVAFGPPTGGEVITEAVHCPLLGVA